MKCSFGCMRIHSEKAHVCSFLLPVTLSYFGDLVKALIFQVRWKIYYSFPFMGKRNKKARVVFFFFFFSLLLHYFSDLVKAFLRVRMNVCDLHFAICAHAARKCVFAFVSFML